MFTPKETADNMLRRYRTVDKAIEAASWYALDARWVTKKSEVESYWLAVVEHLKSARNPQS